MNGDTHEKIWNELNSLKEKTYKQETQIELLKEKNAEEKIAKDRAMAWNLRGFGILSTALMAVVAYSFTLNGTIATFQTKIDAIEIEIKSIQEGVNKNFDWVEKTFEKKE